MLEERGENPFKVRAYRRAATRVARFRGNVLAEVRAGHDLTRVPDIGPGVMAALHWIARGGEWGQLELPLEAPEIGSTRLRRVS